MAAPPGDPRVDELRQRLRALGYLEAGVDRFVLAPARESRGPLAIAALSAVRVGILAAALLGPAAALGTAVRLPALVTGTRDAIVVAGYLAILFGVAATVATFGAGLLVSRLPGALFRSTPAARFSSRAVGILVGTVSLVYLTLWWRITGPDAAPSASWWTALALVTAVAISLMLGHVTALTTLAVLAAAHGLPRGVRPRPRSQWRITAAAGAAAFAGATALLVLSAPDQVRALPAPALAVVSPGLRVKVIAIDGFDPEVARSLIAGLRTPALGVLFEGGTIRVTPDEVRDPARAWTTVATGQPADVHGVMSLETRRVAGVDGTMTSAHRGSISRAIRATTDLFRLTRPSTASRSELRAKPFWEVAADAGLRTAVVNWWASWPAVPVGTHPPIVISDRAALRLERGGELDAEISPAAFYDRLRGEWQAIKRDAEQTVQASLPVRADTHVVGVLKRAAEIDAVQLAIASRLRDQKLDVLAVYLPGLDIAQHALLGEGPVAPSALAERLDALRDYYVYLDRSLREVTAPAENELVVVVTQPGRITSVSHGMMAAIGSAVATGVDARAEAVDIAPTLLYALGVPIGADLSGRPVLDLFSTSFRVRFPVRQVESYGRRTPGPVQRGQPLDDEMIERLRSLGYVR
jgi:hypothetical protein